MNRRVFVRGLAAGAAALPLTGFFLTEARAAASFRAVVVDTRPLAGRGAGAAAAILGPHLKASLLRELAGRVGRSGPTLIVRLEYVFLASYAGDGFALRDTPSDWLDGSVIAGNNHFPLSVTQSAGTGGAWYRSDNEVRRLRTLADQYAGWVARKV